MKIAVVFGTRPEAIKMAPVVKALQNRSDIETIVCVSGQHRSLLDQVLNIFSISPDIDLKVMKSNQTLVDVTTAVLHGISDMISKHRPDRILVHGDTTTAMAAAMAAFYHRIPVGHVEAGLRTRDIWQPWPEEMNRRIIDLAGDWLFAPTAQARNALLEEGTHSDRIFVTGNTVIDALLMAKLIVHTRPELKESFDRQFSYLDRKKRLVLVTGHRRENFGDGLSRMCEALRRLAERGDVQILFPVHPNENVQRTVRHHLQGIPDVFLVEPSEYLPFIYLMERSVLVITDSGGIQEEAPSLGKPVLVTRDVTERPEAVDAGTAQLVGTDPEKIFAAATYLLDDCQEYNRVSQIRNPYGDGLSAERIVKVICDD